MRKLIFSILLIIVSQQFCQAGKVSWGQYFYAIRQIFPQIKNVSVIITEEAVSTQEKSITRAAAAFKLKIKLFPVADTREIGSEMKLMDEGSILIIFDDPLFMNKSSMIYILSKARDKNISVITCSEKYAEAGAFLTLIKDQSNKLRLVVNLKFQPEFAAKFTPELQKKLGISEILK